MRRLKKAGLTLLISSILLSNSVLHAFADQTATSPVITDVVPVETSAASTEATVEFQESLGPGQFARPTEPAISPGNPIPETEVSETEIQEVITESTEASDQPVIIAPEAPSVPEETVQESAQPAMDETGPLSVPKRIPRLQTQILLRDALQWSSPFVNDQPITVDDSSFSSISTYLEGIHGDLLYRTYSTAAGWSRWAMNGQQTALIDGWPLVEAIQFRFSGPVADQYDIYYTASLSNKTYTSWAKNGMTCGAMNQGITMTGFRLMFVEKGTDPQLDLSRPVFAAHADGIQYIDGVLRYIHGADGSNYTGWGWVGDDRYYFRDSYPVTGWQYIDGYKYYFGEDGKMWTDVEPLIGTAGPFMIRINKEMNCLTIYAQDGANGFIIPVKSFLVSTGDDTPLGTFKTPEKYRWRLMIHDVWTQYATRLGSGLSILMHSIIYDAPDPYTVWASTYNNLGIARSAGCIRLTTADSKWIYDYCPVGTTVEVYNSPIPGPFNRPTIDYEIPFEQRWDPTDPSLTPEGIEASRQSILAAHGIQ